jgi:CheY-like chemotaxis protein
LQQIVWNLISNSIKYTPREGRVRVTLERVNSHVEICVSDTGEGIHAEFLPYVFERFRQADSATTRRHGGLGLGLSIVKQLVELHGGTVTAQSPGEGKGATFRVALPLNTLQRDDDDHLRHHPKTGIAAAFDCAAPTLSGIKVLIVDDEPDTRNLLKRFLQDCGAKADTCSSVDEALRLIGEVNPDVILSDIGMPERDGYDFARTLRSLPPDKGGTIPAVALTAFARSDDRTRAMMAGFDVHVAKPVEPNELRAVVARLAGRASAADPQ